jgi:hypothetical protein
MIDRTPPKRAGIPSNGVVFLALTGCVGIVVPLTDINTLLNDGDRLPILPSLAGQPGLTPERR